MIEMRRLHSTCIIYARTALEGSCWTEIGTFADSIVLKCIFSTLEIESAASEIYDRRQNVRNEIGCDASRSYVAARTVSR